MRDHESTGWAKLIWRYQLGDPEAIRELAAQRGSLVVGLILVLSAGIAREYDHEYIGEATHFFFLPLLASLLIALILYETRDSTTRTSFDWTDTTRNST